MASDWTELAYMQLQAGNTATVRVRAGGHVRLSGPGGPVRELEAAPGGHPGGADVPALLAGGRELAGLDVSLFTQIGFVVLVGLASKNAILIVEFAKTAQESGVPRREATLQACRLRLRPILMTSFAFILGVVPLVLAEGRRRRDASLAGLGRLRRYAGRDRVRHLSHARLLLRHPVVRGATNARRHIRT